MEILLETPYKTDTACRREEETYLSISLSLRQKLCTMGGEVPYVANTGFKRERGERKLRFFFGASFPRPLLGISCFRPDDWHHGQKWSQNKNKDSKQACCSNSNFFRGKNNTLYELSCSFESIFRDWTTELLYNTINPAVTLALTVYNTLTALYTCRPRQPSHTGLGMKF